MSTILVMEAMNLFLGDADPTKSKHLTLANVKLPSLEEDFVDHKPGGSRFGVKLSMGIQAPVCTFKLNGVDPDAEILFGLGTGKRQKFTARGMLVDKATSDQIPVLQVMEGRLGKLEYDEFSRGDLMGADHTIDEILHMERYINGKEILYWNFFTQAWRVNGVSQNDVERNILGIAG